MNGPVMGDDEGHHHGHHDVPLSRFSSDPFTALLVFFFESIVLVFCRRYLHITRNFSPLVSGITSQPHKVDFQFLPGGSPFYFHSSDRQCSVPMVISSFAILKISISPYFCFGRTIFSLPDLDFIIGFFIENSFSLAPSGNSTNIVIPDHVVDLFEQQTTFSSNSR